MPAGSSIRVANAHVDFGANVGGYLAGTRQVAGANRGLFNSYRELGRQAERNSLLVSQFSQSLTSSLVATAAYAVGVGGVSLALGGSTRSFIEYEAGLIRVGKTADITGDQLDRLGEEIVRINTQRFGESRALGITRDNLLSIAEATGQLGIRGVGNIARFTRASAALELSSNLIGVEAARALGRFLEVTDTSADRVDEIASAFTALGNEVAGSESEIAQFAQRIAQESRGTGGLSNETILALGASFVNVGARPESAATVVGRTLDAINQIASERSLGRLRLIGEAAGAAEDEVLAIGRALQDGSADADTYSRALELVVRALARLPKVAAEGTVSRSSLLELIFSNTNVRIRTNLSLLAQGLEDYTQFLETANRATQSSNAHYVEAGRAAEGYGSRLAVVRAQLEDQGRTIGAVLTPALVGVAENFRLVEIAAAGTATALVTGFTARRVRNIREYATATRAAATAERARASAELAGNRRRVALLQLERANATTFAQRIRVNERVLQSQQKVVASRARLSAATLAVARSERIATTALRRFGAGALAFLGGPIGLITTALTAGALAWAFWGRNAGIASEQTRSARRFLADLVDETEREASGLTDSAFGIQQVQEELGRLYTREAELERQIRRRQQSLAERGITISAESLVGTELQNVRTVIAELEAGLRQVGATADAEQQSVTEFANSIAGAPLFPARGIVRTRQEFELLGRSLNTPTRRVQEFYRAIDEGNRNAIAAARLESSIVGLSIRDQNVAREIASQQAEIDVRRAGVARQLTNEREDLARVDAFALSIRDQITRKEAGQLALGTKARAEADALLKTVLRDVALREQRVSLLEQELQLTGDLVVNEEQIRRRIDEERNAAINRALTVSDDTSYADQGRRAAEQFLESLERQLETGRRTAEQARDLAQIRDPVARAGQAARFDIENRFLDERSRIINAITQATRELAEAEAEVLRLEAEARAGTGDVSRLQDAVSERQARERELEQLREQKTELDSASGSQERFARSAAETARINEEVARSFLTLPTATELAASGLNRLENTLVNVAETGKLAMGQLVRSIIADLGRLLIRVTITQNALIALQSAFPGVFGAPPTASAAPGGSPARDCPGTEISQRRSSERGISVLCIVGVGLATG